MTPKDELLACDFFDQHRDKGYFTSSNPLAQQRKLLEEVGEFIEACLIGDIDAAAMEAGDVAWLIVDMLHVMGSPFTLDQCMEITMTKLQQRHSGDQT